MPSTGFEPAIPGSERLQTHALDRSATGIGCLAYISNLNPSFSHITTACTNSETELTNMRPSVVWMAAVIQFSKHTITGLQNIMRQISYNKPIRCTNFSNLFSKETLHVSDSSSAHHEFFTVQTAMVYAIQVMLTHTIAVCTVKNSWWWAEELSETCRVSFQKKFHKLVHLVCLL